MAGNTDTKKPIIKAELSTEEKKKVIVRIGKQIEDLDYKIKIAKLEYEKKLKDLTDKKTQLMKEKTKLTRKKRQPKNEDSW